MKKLFDFLAINKVTPNGLLVLDSIYNNYTYTNFINLKHEKHRLEITGFLKSEKNKDDIIIYKITDKGLHIIKETDKIMKNYKNAKKKSKIPFEEWEYNITTFNEMFPKGKKQGSTVYFRTNPKELFNRFQWFFTEYPEYTWEDVLYATEKYVKTYEENGSYIYMQTSKYFIKKDDKSKNTVSNLATLCFNIANGDDIDMNDGTFYFGP